MARRRKEDGILLMRHIGYANAMAEEARSRRASTYRYIQHNSPDGARLERDIDALMTKHKVSYLAAVNLEREQ